MKRLIIAMIITNILLIAQIEIDRKNAEELKLSEQIVTEELIPIEVIEEQE